MRPGGPDRRLPHWHTRLVSAVSPATAHEAPRASEADELLARLDIGPPARLAVGRGNAFAIAGYAYHLRQPIRALAIQVGDSVQPVERLRLPRQDVYEGLARDDPARAHAFRSGFAALLDLDPIERPQLLELSAHATLRDGRRASARLGELHAEPGIEPPVDHGIELPAEGAPRVAICMATYNPPPDLLRRQLDSLKEQTHANWICVISDDCSDPEAFARLEAEVSGDPRFVLSRGERRLGYYRNFERALSMAPRSADYVTLCDQDDRWHPAKVERLLEEIGDSQLVYSDARIVSPAGEVVAGSYWTERRNNYTNFASLLLANSVTGAAALFRRDLLDDALPFPPELAARTFHDHWLAVVAMARGEIAYLDESLYDYVQHGAAVIGHGQANKRPRSIRRHLIERLRNPTGGSRAVYYYAWHQQLIVAEVLRLRCWDRMTAAKRRTVRRLLSADSRLSGLAWLLGRRARRLWGHDETLDRELFYGHALLRRRAVSLWTLGGRRPNRLLPRDQSVPSTPEHR
jgi:glycosyltransferase involved in cell wall biosynthesis